MLWYSMIQYVPSCVFNNTKLNEGTLLHINQVGATHPNKDILFYIPCEMINTKVK